MKALKMIVTGGGTGGHLFPGIAVADAFRSRCPGAEIMFVGTGRLIDARALAQREYQRAAIHCQGLKGKSGLARIGALLQLPLSLLEAVLVLRRFRPALVFGVGGYVTGPVVLAARLLNIVTCIHEQNSVPGLANRWLGRVVDRIFLSIPGSENYFPQAKTVLSGNPVRRELVALQEAAAASQENASAKATILILGGSQGAHRINELVTAALGRLPGAADLNVIHQTGAEDEAMVRQAYQGRGIKAEVAAFFTDMAAVYSRADLIISRAGATTIAELTLLGKAAILIPFPFAADNHQEKNAQFLIDHEAAVMFRERDLTPEKLAGAIETRLADRQGLRKMRAAAASLARRDAVEVIVDDCLKLLGQGEKNV